MSSESQSPYNPLFEARHRLAERGASVLSTSELLGLVLGTGAIHDALQVSEQLIARYQGLVAIAQIGVFELQEQRGVGEAKATQIVAALELGKRVTVETRGPLPQIRTPADAASLCMPDMGILEQEHMRVLFLDTRKQVIGMRDVYVGTVNSVSIRIADLFREAVRHNSSSIVIAHNHPSGDASPSSEDQRVTRQVVEAGKLLDINVMDHLVIGRGSFVSLRERLTEIEWD
jgi:DNA repair protein RadC